MRGNKVVGSGALAASTCPKGAVAEVCSSHSSFSCPQIKYQSSLSFLVKKKKSANQNKTKKPLFPNPPGQSPSSGPSCERWWEAEASRTGIGLVSAGQLDGRSGFSEGAVAQQ